MRKIAIVALGVVLAAGCAGQPTAPDGATARASSGTTTTGGTLKPGGGGFGGGGASGGW